MITKESIVGQDVRFSLRLLRKYPGFTVVAIVTLALGICANAVAFGVFNGLILTPLNVPREESLYALQRGNDNYPAQSYPDYIDVRDRNSSFESLAAFSMIRVGLDSGDRPTRAGAIWRAEISSTHSAFSPILVVSSTPRMSVAPTALLI
jgi:hypothetical protein